MSKFKLGLGFAAIAFAYASPSFAQEPVAVVQGAGTAAADVAAFYQRFPGTRIWFKAGADDAAIDRLVAAERGDDLGELDYEQYAADQSEYYRSAFS